MLTLPSIVRNCDWGAKATKRWMATAFLSEGRYTAHAPEHVEDVRTLISRTRALAGSGSALIGFDFPIGIPNSYATKVCISSFRSFLRQLGQEEWGDFYRVCECADDISPRRPFYPNAPGSKRQAHLLKALGVEQLDDLRRRCELKQHGRSPACALFWTLGANQVGKGAIVGWRDVISPALNDYEAVKLWPFDGMLRNLLLPGRTVIAETYPAEYWGWLSETKLKGKGKLHIRKAAGRALFRWAQNRGVQLEDNLVRCIEMGFPEGDDAFDAAVGLFGMLDVVLNKRGTGEPDDDVIAVEGWILGQEAKEAKNGYR